MSSDTKKESESSPVHADPIWGSCAPYRGGGVRGSANGMWRSVLWMFPIVLLFVGRAFAQDFGARWIDRVSQEKLVPGDDLRDRPLTLTLEGGELYYFDDNIYLDRSNENSDSIFVTFLRARMDYAEPRFEAVVDAMIRLLTVEPVVSVIRSLTLSGPGAIEATIRPALGSPRLSFASLIRSITS